MEATEVKQEVAVLAEKAAALVIRNDDDNEIAGAFLVDCARQLKNINSVFDPIISKAHAAHKEALAKKKEFAGPVETAKRKISGLIGEYDRKKEAERREAERKARAEARRIEEERRIKEAEALEKVGQAEAAEAVIEKPLPVPAPAPPPPVRRPSGISVRKAWAFRVLDPSKIKPEYMIPDEKKIGQVVRAMGAQAAAMIGEGVEIYEKEIVSARTA